MTLKIRRKNFPAGNIVRCTYNQHRLVQRYRFVFTQSFSSVETDLRGPTCSSTVSYTSIELGTPIYLSDIFIFSSTQTCYFVTTIICVYSRRYRKIDSFYDVTISSRSQTYLPRCLNGQLRQIYRISAILRH